MSKLRIERDLTMAEYLESPGISKHQLDIFHECPRDYERYQRGLWKITQSRPMLLGSMLHAAILEKRIEFVTRPAVYENEKGEVKPWNGNSNVCKAWLDEHDGDNVLSEFEAQWIHAATQSVREHSDAQRILSKGTPELSCFAGDLRARIDWLTPDGIIADLKTTTSAAPGDFEKEIVNRRYHVQAAMYRKVAGLLDIPFQKFVFILVENVDAFNRYNRCRVSVRELRSSAIDQGEFELEADLKALRKCQETGAWPDIDGVDRPSLEYFREIGIPQWAFSEPELTGF